MIKVLASPSRYVQGAGALDELAALMKPVGKKPLVILDSFVAQILDPQLKRVLGSLECTWERFGGEVTKKEIQRLQRIGQEAGSDSVIGVGGGKTLDTAKAVAYYAKVPVVIVPTIAATDAPTSALAVIYTEEGQFQEYLFLPRNPELVLVDTAVVAKAPVRFLISGMGDALSTWFEADACARSTAKNVVGGRPTAAALAIARQCYDTLLEYGLAARLAVEHQAVTPAVEKVVEANILLSGMGFESGGLAAAHAIHNGLTALPATHDRFHGEKVAFATLCQLMLEGKPEEELEEVYGFCETVALPTTLADLGVQSVDAADLRRVAEMACAPEETIHNMPFPVTPEQVVAAIQAADAWGRQGRSEF